MEPNHPARQTGWAEIIVNVLRVIGILMTLGGLMMFRSVMEHPENLGRWLWPIGAVALFTAWASVLSQPWPVQLPFALGATGIYLAYTFLAISSFVRGWINL